MDKRYILIFLIIVVCCFNLYLIASSSDIVGSASVNFKEYTFSLPSDFTMYESSDNYIVIYNPHFGYTSLLFNKESYESELHRLGNDSNCVILSNGPIQVNNITVNSIFYRTSDANNHSIFIFDKLDKTFRVEMWHFNYDNRNASITIISDIVESLRPNKL